MVYLSWFKRVFKSHFVSPTHNKLQGHHKLSKATSTLCFWSTIHLTRSIWLTGKGLIICFKWQLLYLRIVFLSVSLTYKSVCKPSSPSKICISKNWIELVELINVNCILGSIWFKNIWKSFNIIITSVGHRCIQMYISSEVEPCIGSRMWGPHFATLQYLLPVNNICLQIKNIHTWEPNLAGK